MTAGRTVDNKAILKTIIEATEGIEKTMDPVLDALIANSAFSTTNRSFVLHSKNYEVRVNGATRSKTVKDALTRIAGLSLTAAP